MDLIESMETIPDDWDEWDEEDCHSSGYARAKRKYLDTVREFLGKGKQKQVPVIRPDYYGELLDWALQQYIKSDGWTIVRLIGYPGSTPEYRNINVDYGNYEQIAGCGAYLVKKDDKRIVAAINDNADNSIGRATVLVTGNSQKYANRFARGVSDLAQGRTLYKGKSIQLGAAGIHFLSLPHCRWEDLVLAPELIDEIKTNTVSFLNRRQELEKYGIPAKRGLILAGEPGTGKTLISKILMNQSPGVTCLVAHARGLPVGKYISDLYEIARDLMPSMVFLEDIDLIGEDRRRSRHETGPTLSTLLSHLDGVEDCGEVVTIATTNFLTDIDDALRKRPSRFDRIIQLPLPSLRIRKELIQKLSSKIQIDDDVQDYLANKTDRFTPAQLQEAVYSLVIEHKHDPFCEELGYCKFNEDDVDKVLILAKTDRNNREMGFTKHSNNGDSLVLKGAHVLNSNSDVGRE